METDVSLRDRDLAQWLTNKLGASDDDQLNWNTTNMIQHINERLLQVYTLFLSSKCTQYLHVIGHS
jgi:hypothetical protein